MRPPIPIPRAAAIGPFLLLMLALGLGPPGITGAVHAADRQGGEAQDPEASADPGGERTDPSADEAPEGEPSLPFIEIDRERRHVDVEGEVCLREGLLELVATIRGGKEHESVFVVDARPRHLHFALLTLGLEPGRPGKWRYENDEPMPIDPTGDPVRITVRYENEDGERVEHPAGRFVRDRNAGEAMGRTRFVFAGSRIEKRGDDPEPTYLADSSGDVVSLVSFNDELLALPTAASNANEKLVWEANTPRIPPVGTKVILRIRPAGSDGDTGNAAGSKEEPAAEE